MSPLRRRFACSRPIAASLCEARGVALLPIPLASPTGRRLQALRRTRHACSLQRGMPPYPKLPPRLDLIYFRHPVFFVTICTHRRRRLLANAPLHETFVAFAERAYATHNIAVGRYVIMPDHLHLFVCGDQEFALGRWIGMLKQFLAKTVDRAGASNACEPVWQRGFFDHLFALR